MLPVSLHIQHPDIQTGVFILIISHCRILRSISITEKEKRTVKRKQAFNPSNSSIQLLNIQAKQSKVEINYCTVFRTPTHRATTTTTDQPIHRFDLISSPRLSQASKQVQKSLKVLFFV